MAKTKKITTATILKAMQLNEDKKIIIACGTTEDTVEISVKPRLSLSERMSMVSDIADMVFITGDDGEIEYVPAFKKFAIEYEIVNYFTDIVLPADSEKTCEFLENTGIANRIVNSLRDSYVIEIITEANELIEYRKQALLKRSKLDTVLDSIVDVIETVGDKAGGIELPQILEYVQKNAPELKGEVEQLIKSQAAEVATV